MAKKDTRRYSPTELRDLAAKGDVLPTRADAPEMHLDEEFWANASVVIPDDEGKERVTIRLDRDIVDFFKERGRGYQSRMNAVLRSFVDAHRQGPK